MNSRMESTEFKELYKIKTSEEAFISEIDIWTSMDLEKNHYSQ